MKKPKLPALMFYTGDWLKDDVARCSLAAQGLWLRMMIVAHSSKQYGYLSQQGEPIPSDAIARACGASVEEYSTLLSELDRAGVPSRTTNGIIFSRRMLRDEKLRSERKKAGKCGGNPKLRKSNLVNQKDNQIDKQNTEYATVIKAPHEELQKAWNELGAPYAKISKWNDSRKKALTARWRDEFFRANWLIGISRLMKAEFAKGNGGTGWIMDIDFFLKAGSLEKILEGKYDGAHKQGIRSQGLPATAVQADPLKYQRLAARAIDAISERVDESTRTIETSDGESIPY